MDNPFVMIFYRMTPRSLLFHVRVHEGKGQQVFYALEAIDALCAIEQDGDGSPVSVFHLHDDLPATATGGDWLPQHTLVVAGGNGQGEDGLLGFLGLGGEDGRSFRA